MTPLNNFNECHLKLPIQPSQLKTVRIALHKLIEKLNVTDSFRYAYQFTSGLNKK